VSASRPRPAYDRWRDAEGIHVDDGCRVEQVEVAKEHGALRRRLGKRGVVTGRSASNRLYVRFEREVGQVAIRRHLVRVLAADADAPRNVEEIIAALVRWPPSTAAASTTTQQPLPTKVRGHADGVDE
jgi:hypothetical protein